MVTPDKFSPEELQEEACEHGYFTSCPHCRAKAEKGPDLKVVGDDEVVEVSKETKEEKEDLKIGTYTEASSSHPDRNEDESFAQNEMAGIFDGMGGENAGDVASAIASETIQVELQAISANATLDQKTVALEHAFHKAHQAIIDSVTANPEYKGMGTTATVVLRHEGSEGSKLIIGNVGDGRVYRVEGGQATLETDDDSIVNFLVENGLLNDDQDLSQPIPDHIKNDPGIIATFKKPPETLSDIRRGVTQAIGKKEIQPKITVLDARPGSRFILSSDGIHDHLTDEQIGQIGSKDKSGADVSKELVDNSRAIFEDKSNPRRKPDDDDKTAIVIDFPKKETQAALKDLMAELSNVVADEEEGVYELTDEDLKEMAV